MKNTFNLKPTICIVLLILTTFLRSQLGFSTEPDAMNRARIKPTLTEVEAGSEQQFYVVKEPGRLTSAYATNMVSWFVNGYPGGNEKFGTITVDGLYHAPQKMSETSEIYICAEVENASNRYLWATVLINGIRPGYKTVNEWGEEVGHSKYLNNPRAIDIERNGNILIADNELLRFSPDGKFMNKLGSAKLEVNAHARGQRNVKVDAYGHIFTSDPEIDKPLIQVYSQNGVYLYGFSQKGTGPGKVLETHGMAFDTEQRLFIADMDNMRVNVYEHSGDFIHSIGGKGLKIGEFNVPHGLVLDANNDLFVVNYYGPCQKLTPDGNFVMDFAFANPPEGPIYYTDLASDRWGNVYLIVKGDLKSDGKYDVVHDEGGNPVHIMKYNNNGDFVANIQLAKKERDALRLIVNEQGKIYVLFKGEEMIGVEILEQ